jgi:large subunit ribosomal protein L24e
MRRGTGKIVSSRLGELMFFCSTKCERNHLMGRKSQRTKWTLKYEKGRKVAKKEEKVVEKPELVEAREAPEKKKVPKKERRELRHKKKLEKKADKKARKAGKEGAPRSEPSS